MPSLRESMNVDRSRLAPGRSRGNAAGAGAPPPATSVRSPLIDSSLPTLAAGGDIYTRQFYNQGGLPQRRFLPVRSV